MTPEQALTLAAQAYDLTKNDAFAAVVAELLEDNRRAWEDAKTTQERETLWHERNALRKVISQLKVTVGRGSVAQAELDRQARRETKTR